MIFDFILIPIAFYFTIPGVAGYSASSYGRSFWKWFILATFLPIITHLVLYFLIKRDIKNKKMISLLKKEEIAYMENQIQEIKHVKKMPSTAINGNNSNNLIKE